METGGQGISRWRRSRVAAAAGALSLAMVAGPGSALAGATPPRPVVAAPGLAASPSRPVTALPAPAAGAPAVSGCLTVDCVVDRVLPGATTSETPESPTTCGGRGTDTLHIRLPASVARTSASPTQAPYVYESLGWRGLIAASDAATVGSDISGYALSYHDGAVPAAAKRAFTACIKPTLLAAADALHQSLARRQMRVNLRTFASALPAGSILRRSISLVEIDPARNRYALVVQVRLRRLSDLEGRVGDGLDGLLAGFGHAGDESLTEGVGIEIRSPAGVIAANWTSNRSGRGLLAYSSRLHVTSLVLTKRFAVVDGGPPAAPSKV